MATDPNQAVDSAGTALAVGDTVNIFKARIVGFKVDANNHLNVWIVPALNAIKTPDSSNPLNNVLDGKAVLVSGYNCTKVTTPGSTIASVLPAGGALTAVEASLTAALADSASALPSNFLAPSIT